jgi:1-acyl-sn-glycerol-3-phosphate acyltransferase
MDSPHGFAAGPALIRLGLAGLFVTVPRLALRVEAHGLDLDPRAPRTIYAITHKRHPDTFASPPIILAHRGWRGLTRDTRFIMRADAFQTGFLARLIERPDWLRRAIHPFSVGPVLAGAGVYPMDGFHSRPAELWIRDALVAEGDQPAGALLAPETLRELASATDETVDTLAALPLAALARWRYAVALQLPTGPGILAGQARRRAERRMVETARAQLRAMSDWLVAGGSLILAPEGHLSVDGLLSTARAGLRLLLRDAPPDTRVQPVAIVYDSLTTGRLRMVVDFAPQIVDAARLTASQLDQRLRAAWLDAARVTCSQLATAALVLRHVQTGAGAPAAGLVSELEAATHTLARALDAAGRHVDAALLTAAGARARVARYLRQAAPRGLATIHGGAYTFAPGALPDRADAPVALPGVPPDGVGYDIYPLRYAWNEAYELLTAAGMLTEATSLANQAVDALAEATPDGLLAPKKA